MVPDKPESWGFQGLTGFLRDLGPTEEEKKVYRKFKELYQKATTMSAGEPSDEWRPPGKRSIWDEGHGYGKHPGSQLMILAADSVETTLKLRQNKPIRKPSDKEEECHRKLMTLAIKMGDMMKLQAEQVRINTANEDLQQQAHFVTKELQTWAYVASAPDCGLRDRDTDVYNWEPDHLIKKYHKTMSSPKAVALVDGYSPGNDLLLLPSTGGWEAALDVLHKEKILERYPGAPCMDHLYHPSMEGPWCKAVALRLKVVTRRETNGRRDKDITEVTVAPMFGPEYRYHE